MFFNVISMKFQFQDTGYAGCSKSKRFFQAALEYHTKDNLLFFTDICVIIYKTGQ